VFLRTVTGLGRIRRFRPLPKPDTAFPAKDLLPLKDEHRAPFNLLLRFMNTVFMKRNTRVDGGGENRGIAALALRKRFGL
jgi:hypothetical protein